VARGGGCAPCDGVLLRTSVSVEGATYAPCADGVASAASSTRPAGVRGSHSTGAITAGTRNSSSDARSVLSSCAMSMDAGVTNATTRFFRSTSRSTTWAAAARGVISAANIAASTDCRSSCSRVVGMGLWMEAPAGGICASNSRSSSGVVSLTHGRFMRLSRRTRIALPVAVLGMSDACTSTYGHLLG
jgi:hypothetical protein